MHKKIGLELLKLISSLAQLKKINNQERVYAVKCIKEYMSTADPEAIETLLEDILVFKITKEEQKIIRSKIHE